MQNLIVAGINLRELLGEQQFVVSSLKLNIDFREAIVRSLILQKRKFTVVKKTQSDYESVNNGVEILRKKLKVRELTVAKVQKLM